MSVFYHEKSREFHLTNGRISYILSILDNGEPGHIYFGKAVHDRPSFAHRIEYRCREMSPYCFPDRPEFSMNHLQQEYPNFGHGDLREPAYVVRRGTGSTICEFRFRAYRISRGKPPLPGLPSTYTESDDEADTLELELFDERMQASLTLTYTIFRDFDAVARSVRFENHSTEPLVLERAMSASIDFPDRDFEMIRLTGTWARERAVQRTALSNGIQRIYSRRGCSGAVHNPFLALVRPDTTEHSGEAYGFSLVYSGNFLAQTEVDAFDVSRVMLGIHPDGFSWPLRPGERFTTPEAVAVYSDSGLSGMSGVFHPLYRSRLARGTWRDRPRPILINSWEAAYFDFDEEKLMALARKAADVGIELFVLDDGWFSTRTNDHSGLGDWWYNKERFPNGLGGFARRLKQLGLDFGFWIEPEMVNADSELYRAHPDWILRDPDRFASLTRNQYVLDYSRPEVVTYIGDLICAALRESGAVYIKWDMNRCITECFSSALGPEDQGTVYHRYILGVYALYERLTREFPHVLFESCASGGARFDPGMLYYAPQCWTSDNTDAMQRVEIQYGTSFVYPISCMGAHVSASPNHQLNRHSSLSARADAAIFGTFGYELDLTRLPQEDLDEIARQVAWMKQHRALMQFGDFYRLRSPFECDDAAWMVVSPDASEAVVGWYRFRQPASPAFSRVRLRGLDPDADYIVQPLGLILGGDELMHMGLSTSDLPDDTPCDSKTKRFYLSMQK